MIIGQVLKGREDSGSGSSVYYSPWFPRRGNGAVMSVQVIDFGGALYEFTIEVEHKNSDDTDPGSATSPNNASLTLSAGTGSLQRYTTDSWEVGENVKGTGDGFLELVRFKYTLGFQDAGDEGWVHFRMLAPQWLSNGA